jgi:hypothetical protein
MKRRLVLAGVVSLALVAVACGGDTSVGSPELKKFKEGVGGALRDTTTTTAALVAPTGRGGIDVSTTVTTRPTTTTTHPTASTLVVAINSDNDPEGQFNPTGGRVVKGAFVQWVNHDTQARSVKADNGTFVSPTLAPGQSWTWTANVLGRINYHDGTRPYALGFVEVVTR